MKIYTKTGDQGKTRLVGGTCVDKSNLRVRSYGDIDELNSFLGVAICGLQPAPLSKVKALAELSEQLIQIQNWLFNLGSLVACENPELHSQLPSINDEHIKTIENQIDKMSAELTPLKNFILPGGTEAAAHLHVARSVCRRSERELVGLLQSPEFRADPDPHIEGSLHLGLTFLNRLSDYFFVAARYANHHQNYQDKIWKK